MTVELSYGVWFSTGLLGKRVNWSGVREGLVLKTGKLGWHGDSEALRFPTIEKANEYIAGQGWALDTSVRNHPTAYPCFAPEV